MQVLKTCGAFGNWKNVSDFCDGEYLSEGRATCLEAQPLQKATGVLISSKSCCDFEWLHKI